jgi:AcrR family transcriptional regulator
LGAALQRSPDCSSCQLLLPDNERTHISLDVFYERTHILNNETGKTRPKKRERVQKKEKTRRAILKAALDLFAAKGFYATTTKAISRKARIAEGTLFNYFETKEDLALYFFEEELSGVAEWYRANKRLQKTDIAEKLFAIIQHLLERVEPYEEFIGAVYLRALSPTSKLSPFSFESQDRHLRYLRFIREILREAEENEEIPPVGDFGAYAFGLFQLAILTHWLRDQSRGKEETLALLDRCLKMATHFLRNGGWNW